MCELTEWDLMKVASQLDVSSDFHSYHFRLQSGLKNLFGEILMYARALLAIIQPRSIFHGVQVHMHAGYVITELRKRNYGMA